MTTETDGKHGAKRKQRVQWAAQFAVASELCKRGYEVGFTMGNATPLADLLVVTPTERMFRVDVKGAGGKNEWLIMRKSPSKDLFYILAYVPADDLNRFFILTQETINHRLEMELIKDGKTENFSMMGLPWKDAIDHENKWDILPP